MGEPEVIYVEAEVDIISARMQVRDMARAIGFNTGDQARISLATSSLAHFLDLGGKFSGRITLAGCNTGKTGLRVTCEVNCGKSTRNPDYLQSRELEKVRWMVDDLVVEVMPTNNVRVVMTKWAV